VRTVPVVVGAGAERGEAGAAEGREIGVSEVEPGVRDGDTDSKSSEAEIAGRGADPLDARWDDLPGAPAAAVGFGVRADGTVRDDGDDLGVLFEELARGDIGQPRRGGGDCVEVSTHGRAHASDSSVTLADVHSLAEDHDDVAVVGK